MSSRRLQRVTYSLPGDLLDRVRSAVKGGAAPSYSAFVEQALAARVRLVDEEQLAVAFRSAATDPVFLADIEHTMVGFDGGETNAKHEDR